MNEYVDMVNLSSPLNEFPITRLNGPGWRLTLFVQGCPLRCTDDCLNEDQLEVIPRELVTVADVIAFCLDARDRYGIEGVTFLGGEPFAQALPLSKVAAGLRERNLSVMTYSGYSHESLSSSRRGDWDALLANSDILVDGPFLSKQMSKRILWRGSFNQRILLLSERFYTTEFLTQNNLFEPSEATKSNIEVFDPYWQNSLEVHWASLVELAACPCDHRQRPPETANVTHWCPECAGQFGARRYGYKGLIAVISKAGVRIYGHQDKKTVEAFRRRMLTLGIEL